MTAALAITSCIASMLLCGSTSLRTWVDKNSHSMFSCKLKKAEYLFVLHQAHTEFHSNA
ncbi:MAG: hypothetical protein IPL01_13645 [Acidobacteria bacterium]|nr:hypothetical protein [Acidobacteriota bacterium]